MPLASPPAGSFTPQSPPQSQELAQVLAAMRAQQGPVTPIGGSANMIASALNRINDPSNPPQWTDLSGQPSNNYGDSPIGSAVGSLFGLGKIAQGNQLAQNVYDTSQMAAPAGAGQIAGAF